MVNSVAPGTVEWGEERRYKDYPIVKVGIGSRAPGEFGEYAGAIAVRYAQVGETLIVALDGRVLERIIDRFDASELPKRSETDGPQFIAEAELVRDKASWTAVLWGIAGQANAAQGGARVAAEILLRGDPSLAGTDRLRQRALAYFGNYPVTASGAGDFARERFGVADPVHGSEYAPTYPALPVPGSPVAAIMERLTGLRATVAFDREPLALTPPARSLHTKLEVRLGGAHP